MTLTEKINNLNIAMQQIEQERICIAVQLKSAQESLNKLMQWQPQITKMIKELDIKTEETVKEEVKQDGKI